MAKGMTLGELGLLVSQIDGVEGSPLENVDKAIAECESKLRALRVIRKTFADSEPADEAPKPRTRKSSKNGEAVPA